MGYQDRDYMRDSYDGPTRDHLANPLWWILGIIALILVTSGLRRMNSQPHIPYELRELVENSGHTRVARIELIDSNGNSDELIDSLQKTFRDRGFGVTVSQLPDQGFAQGSFYRAAETEGVSQQVVYERRPDSVEPVHHIEFSVMRHGVPEGSDSTAAMQALAVEIRGQIEREFPNMVSGFDLTVEETLIWNGDEFD